ncbi:MAG: precorrin-8X methylmutase [Oscillospiraceae bacterium]|nr:precorrin-8X methylmutase [Oscillospiraceae bacterium]
MSQTPLQKRNSCKKGDRILKLEYVLPNEIEARSFEIIAQELPHEISEEIRPIVMRVIHTTADFDYLDQLCFSKDAVRIALDTIRQGAVFLTDTNMARAGINQSALQKMNCEALCYMADAGIAKTAQQNATTRAAAAVDRAAQLGKPVIYAVGNAPTALLRLHHHILQKTFIPALVIGVPVGFVNVVQSKECIMETDVPYIIAKGRKGGSNVAAAICNALLYMAGGR